MKRLIVMMAIASGTMLFAGAAARATCCSADADCPRGAACRGGSCDVTTVDCACDSDCGPNLYCVPGVATVCTQSAGSATQDCHPLGRCMTAWQRPCAVDADCGPGGFTCVPNGRFCNGSDCQTTATCVAPALPATCARDADCPAAWTCETDTALAAACIPVQPHSCPSGGCPPMTPTGARACVPPSFDLVGPAAFTGPPVVLPPSCPAKTDGGVGRSPGASEGCQIGPGSGSFFSWLSVLGFLAAGPRRRSRRPPVGARGRSG